MKLEVLVATMGQENLALAEKMNITAAAVLANQCDRWDYEQQQEVRMISTATRGVGINRNLALQLSEADILLFADDDVRYYDGALEGVLEAFRQLPDADVVFFGLDMTRDGKVFDKRRNKVRRVHIWNALRYGTARMAVRRSAVMEKRLCFTTLFGGGCKYSSGEDTVFIADCLRAGLKAYSHDLVLGTCAKDSSSWFEGVTEKYLYDRGAMVACVFPRLKHLMKWHFARKTAKKHGVSMKKVLRYMNMGIKGFKTLKGYDQQEN